MRTLILDPRSAGLDELLERRRRLGLDRSDEVWEGVYHMAPAPSHGHAVVDQQLAVLLDGPARAAGFTMTGPINLGQSDRDYRVPDRCMHRPGAAGTWHPTAPLAVEIVSPDDESWEKLSFYADHGVEEVLIVDPLEHMVHWLALEDGEYREIERSRLIDLGRAELAAAIDWPAGDAA